MLSQKLSRAAICPAELSTPKDDRPIVLESKQEGSCECVAKVPLAQKEKSRKSYKLNVWL
jgi:hypothetical protein